jgi:hypothetical protein
MKASGKQVNVNAGETRKRIKKKEKMQNQIRIAHEKSCVMMPEVACMDTLALAPIRSKFPYPELSQVASHLVVMEFEERVRIEPQWKSKV